MIVAAAGTLAFVDLAGIIYRRLPAFLERPLALLGRRSLDIYAIHFHVLGTWPPIIAPLLYSLAVSTALRLNSWTALIFSVNAKVYFRKNGTVNFACDDPSRIHQQKRNKEPALHGYNRFDASEQQVGIRSFTSETPEPERLKIWLLPSAQASDLFRVKLNTLTL